MNRLKKAGSVLFVIILVALVSCESKNHELAKRVVAEDGYIEYKDADQIVDIKVFDVLAYTSMPKDNLEFQWISTGLFLYRCSKCHGGNGALDDTGLYRYTNKSLAEYLLVVAPEHVPASSDPMLEMDVFDIEAIEAYVRRKMEK